MQIPKKRETQYNPNKEYVFPHERRSIVNPNREKQRGIPGKNLRGSPSQRRSELAPKGSNSEVPAVQFQTRYELAPTGINFEVPSGEFHDNKVRYSNLGLKYRAQGRVFQDLNIWISFCTAHFSSEPTKWKADRSCYDFKFKFKKKVIYVNQMIYTNALYVFILHHYLNRLSNKNLRSIQ